MVVKNLMIITVISFLAQKGLPAIGFDYTNFFALHYWKSDAFYPHQLITHIFLHSESDFMHLLFNMFGLYMFGRVLESTMGEKRFLMYYLITGVGAALVQLISREVQVQMLIAELSGEAMEYVKQNGAHRAIDYASERIEALFGKQAANDDRFDVVYDCATNSGAGEDYKAQALQCLKQPSGQYVAINGALGMWLRLFTGWGQR